MRQTVARVALVFLASLAVAGLVSCASPFNRIELSFDGGDLDEPSIEACVDLALELVGWADSDNPVRADVSVDWAARGNVYNGRIQSDLEPGSYTWTCDVRAAGDSTMTAMLTELQPG